MFQHLVYTDEAEPAAAPSAMGRAQPAVAAHDLGDQVAEQIAAQLEGREPAAWATATPTTAAPARAAAPAAQTKDLGDAIVALMAAERGERT